MMLPGKALHLIWGRFRSRSLQPHPRCSPIEPLEERRLLATFTVTNVLDSGVGSLRQAIINANQSPNSTAPDEIDFAIGSGSKITLATELPDITDPVLINGRSARGFAGTPLVQIDGGGPTASLPWGLHITAGNSTVQGLILDNFSGSAILLDTVGGNTIIGNYIGVGPDGATAAPSGLGIQASSAANTIGGSASLDRNVISGNSVANIEIQSDSNIVAGNYIGITAAGLGMGGTNTAVGILITDGTQNIIGDTVGGASPTFNVISGNAIGVIIEGAGGNFVSRNIIGTDPAGNAAIPNTSWGIFINAPSNIIGGSDNSARNLISGNSGFAIGVDGAVASGNQITHNAMGVANNLVSPLGNNGGLVITDASGTLVQGNIIANNRQTSIIVADSSGASTGNTFTQNSIFGNGSAGIDLSLDGPTPNDVGDADTGPNNLQNFPVIASAASASAGNLDVTGTFDGAPNASITVEVYATHTPNPGGSSQGQTLLLTQVFTTDSNGHADFSHSFTGVSVSSGDIITATATDASGNTSEFSPGVAVNGQGQITATGTVLSEVGTSLNGVVLASFTDAVSGTSPADYVANIDWGDDSSSVGAIQASGNGFDVIGSHQYTGEGNFSVTITITDANDNRSAIATTSIAVSQPLFAVGVPLSAVAGEQLSNVLVATFTDTQNVSGAYTAAIDWGDQTSSPGTVQAVQGVFQVTGTHTYATSNDFTVAVHITSPDNRTTTATATAVVSPASLPLTVLARNPSAIVGVPLLNVQVAQINDDNPDLATDDYTATIDWGDDSETTLGEVSRNSAGRLIVTGSHTYTIQGSYDMHVSVQTTDNRSNDDFGLVNVSTTSIDARGINVAAVEGLMARNIRVATFTDNLLTTPGKGRSPTYSARIDWGDGRHSNGTIAQNASGQFIVRGSHAYHLLGSYPIGVTITSSTQQVSSTNSSAQVVNAPRIDRPLRLIARRRKLGGRVLGFVDVNPFAVASDYTATINWGDETQSPAKVHGGGRLFDVLADAHTYSKPGRYTITIVVTDSTDDFFAVQQTVRIA